MILTIDKVASLLKVEDSAVELAIAENNITLKADKTLDPAELRKLMAYFQANKAKENILELSKGAAKVANNSVIKTKRKKRVETKKNAEQESDLQGTTADIEYTETSFSSKLRKAEEKRIETVNAERKVEASKQKAKQEQEQELKLKQQKLEEEKKAKLNQQKNPKAKNSTEKNLADKNSADKNTADKKTAGNNNKKQFDTAKNKAPVKSNANKNFEDAKSRQSKSKVLKEKADKNWKKHSHRPQDFILGDPDLQDEEDIRQQEQLRTINKKNKHKFIKPAQTQKVIVEVAETITVADLAKKMAMKNQKLLSILVDMGEEISFINGVKVAAQTVIDQDMAILAVEQIGHEAKAVKQESVADAINSSRRQLYAKAKQATRAPIVTVMGHVDHGKTSLLDYIRKANVVTKEAGGITQHIGAYEVKNKNSKITFIDTPGHAAFSAMRARGANNTDLVILVVAADDGVMPQTKEAVEHIKTAKVPFIVAINKIDKEGANIEKITTGLSKLGVISEEWGGDVQFAKISALKGQGITELLDLIELQSEILELTAYQDIPADGSVIESKLDKGRGSVVTVLIKNGTLQRGDIVVAGKYYGKVKQMVDCNGSVLKTANPSQPVEILGLNGVPNAGDDFVVFKNDKEARKAVTYFENKQRQLAEERKAKLSVDNLFAQLQNKEKSKVSILLKSDVQGSTEALSKALAEISTDEVAVDVVYSGVGGISETDINLAVTTSSLIFGFNVRADSKAKKLVEQYAIDLRYYDTIYKVVDDVEGLVNGLIKPEIQQEIVGIAQVRDTFTSPRFGTIAGCLVTEGTIYRNDPIRVLRDNVVIYSGVLESLRRIKDDVASVRNGLECGIGVKDYNDVQVGDLIEVYREKEVIKKINNQEKK